MEGSWEIINGTGELTVPTDPNSGFYPSIGINELVWSSECNGQPISDSIIVELSSINILVVVTGPDSEYILCEGLELDLYGSEIQANFSGFWVQESGPEVELSDYESNAPTFSPTEPGEYIFSWGYLDLCDIFYSSQQSITIHEADFSVEADVDAYLCDGQLIHCFEPEFGIENINGYSWSSANNSANPAFPSDPYTCVQIEEQGEYQFILEYDNNCTEPLSDTLIISVFESFTPEPICDSIPAQILIELPESFDISSQVVSSPYTGQWTQISGNSELEFADPFSSETTITNLSYGTFTLEWTIFDPFCETSFTCAQTLEFISTEIQGCTLPFATNYNEEATFDDQSCEFDFTICDCEYNSQSPYTLLNLGNGIPNSSSSLNFNCETWGYDCGDIIDSPDLDPFNVCNLNLPPENGCTCIIDSLSLSLGQTFMVTDSVLLEEIWQEVELCYGTILISPESGTEPCFIESLSYSFGNEWNVIDFSEQNLEFMTNDIIPFETVLNQIEMSFMVSTISSQSQPASIWIPECSTEVSEFKFEFLLFPNPIENLLTLKPWSNEVYDLKIIDMLGNEVIILTQESGSLELNLADYSIENGTYLIQLSSSSGTSRKKIIYLAK